MEQGKAERDDVTGKTFYTEGTVREYPAGLFVQFEKIIKICEQKFIYLNYSSENYMCHIKNL